MAQPAIEELVIRSLKNRVVTRSVERWLGVAWAALAMLAFGVVLIGVLIGFVSSLVRGHVVDPWLRDVLGLARSTIETSAPRTFISLGGLLIAIVIVIRR
jgi:hypothetical protein